MPSLSPSDVQSLRGGFASFLANLQSQIKGEVFAESLPIIGQGLLTQANANDAALVKLQTLQTKVASNAKLNSLAAHGGDAKELGDAFSLVLKDAGFTGDVVTVNGGEVVLDFSNAETDGSFTVAASTDLALPGLGLDFTGPAPQLTGNLAVDLNIKVGLSEGSFYVEPTATDAVALNVSVGTSKTKGFTNVEATLNGMPYFVSAAKDTSMLSTSIGLTASAGADGRLSGGELSGDLFTASVKSGAANPVMDVFTNMASDAKFPGVGATLNVEYDLSGGELNNNADDNTGFGSAPVVHFENVGVRSGTFISKVVQPFAENIVSVGGEIFKLAHYLATPLPEPAGAILSTFGLGPADNPNGPITLVDILASPEQAANVKKLDKFGTLMEQFAKVGGGAGADVVSLGAFHYSTDASSRDIRNPAMTANSVSPISDSDTTGAANGKVATLLKGFEEAGDELTFPIIQKPGEAYKILLGADADLVRYDAAAPIDISFDGVSRFPVFPGIFGRIAYGAGVKIDLVAGYDTSGIRGFIQSGFEDPSKLLNGFYIGDVAGSELVFDARFTAGVEAGIPGIFTVGVEGGIRGHAELELVDDFHVPGRQPGDGKVNYDELKAVGFDPFKAFTATGKVEAFLSAFVDSVFYSDDFDLGALTLFDFDTSTQQALAAPVAKLAQPDPVQAGRVRLNIGLNAPDRLPGEFDGPNAGESIRISLSDNGAFLISSVKTKSLNRDEMESLGGDLEISGKSVFGNAGQGDDVVNVSAKIKAKVELHGGDGKDLLQGGSGNDDIYGDDGADKLIGAGGDDFIMGNEGRDSLSGGVGDDTLSGGYNSDIITGGLGKDTLYAVDSLTSVDVSVSGLNDQLFGNQGNDKLFGSSQMDILDGGEGADTMVSNGGADLIFVDNKNDKVLPGSATDLSDVSIYSRADDYDLPAPFRVLRLTKGFAGEGEDAVSLPISAKANDLGNTIYGNLASNKITGGDGDDVFYGDSFDSYNPQTGYVTGVYIEGDFNAGHDTLYGGLGNDELRGLNGNDFLDGGLGSDTIIGGYGNDKLYGIDSFKGTETPVADDLQGGEGNDTYFIDDLDVVTDSGGARDVIVKNTGVVILSNYPGIEGVGFFGAGDAIGDGGANSFIGGKGKNTFTGLGGDDTFEGGNGDVLKGGTGDDTYIVTEKGVTIVETSSPTLVLGDTVESQVNFVLPKYVENLYLYGTFSRTGTGNDSDNLIFAYNEGPATLHGGDGDDELYAPDGFALTAHGGYGDDEIFGSIKNDVLYGFAGPKGVSGTNFLDSDNDFLLGGEGNDRLYGGKGNDTLEGGDGNDELHTEANGTVMLKGGSGDDKYFFDFEAVAPGSKITIDESGGVGGNDTVFSGVDIDMENAGVLVIPTDIENLTLMGTFKLSLNGNSSASGALNGFGNLRANKITGNLLDNRLDGRTGNDTINGGLGNDTLIGGVGEDLLIGGDGDDLLDGAADEDSVPLTQRADVMRGGNGDDEYRVNYINDRIEETSKGGMDSVLTFVSYTLPAFTENLFLLHTVGFGGGNQQDNELFGNEAINTLRGYGGSDFIRGFGGSDTLNGDAGNDTLNGGLGSDYIDGGAGNDTIYGTDNPKLLGSSFVDDNSFDNLRGGEGNDKLFGQGGDDYLDGGTGNDTMEGGQGGDRYVVDSPGDKVVELPATTGNDEVSSAISLTIPANVEVLYLQGFENLTGTGTNGGERIEGNGGHNVISGLGGNDFLSGSAGNDTLLGGKGNDFLYGDSASIFYPEGRGDDVLDGGEGNDRMRGQKGDDLYRVDSAGDIVEEDPNEGFDTVETTVGYALSPNVENLTAIGPGKGPVAIDNGKLITGLVLIGNSSKNTIIGGPLNDKLDGGAGADLLIGGKGNDLYHVDQSADRISEFANEGIDQVRSSSEEFTLPENVEDLLVLPEASGSDMTNFMVFATGNNLGNEIRGNNNACYLDGLGGNDSLYGGSSPDQIYGGEGNDLLDGGTGTGSDLLEGGRGDDLYVIRNVFAIIAEITGSAGGKDRAELFVDGYSLPAGAAVEELALVELNAILNAYGNELANVIVGNKFDNQLFAGSGNDTVIGGDGNDTLGGSEDYQFGEFDVLTGGKGADIFYIGGGYANLSTAAPSSGADSFAKITDFKPADGDRIALANGSYVLAKTIVRHVNEEFVLGPAITGLGLFLDRDRDGVFDDASSATPDDIIAIMEGFNPSTIPAIPDIIDFIQA